MSAVYTADCACDYVPVIGIAGLVVIHKATELAACLAYVRAFEAFAFDGGSRYWMIHGPGGHVAGVKDSPYGNLPPPPVPIEIADPTWLPVQ